MLTQQGGSPWPTSGKSTEGAPSSADALVANETIADKARGAADTAKETLGRPASAPSRPTRPATLPWQAESTSFPRW